MKKLEALKVCCTYAVKFLSPEGNTTETLKILNADSKSKSYNCDIQLQNDGSVIATHKKFGTSVYIPMGNIDYINLKTDEKTQSK